MNIYTIYKVFNKITNKTYIGFDSNWPIRQNDHLKWMNIKYKKHKDYWFEFHIALREFGLNNFEWEIIYQSKDKYHTLKIMEPHFIRQYNSYYKWDNGGYNMTLGGEGCSNIGRIPWNKGLTKENHPSIKKISENLSEKQKGRTSFFKGKTHKKESNIKNGLIHAKEFIAISPTNEIIYFKDLTYFCKKYSLNPQSISGLASGRVLKYKKWDVIKIT